MVITANDTIVAGTDGSATAERAVAEAASLARSTGARLVLVSAFSDLHPYRERLQGSAREDLIDLGKVSEQVLQRAADAVPAVLREHAHGDERSTASACTAHSRAPAR